MINEFAEFSPFEIRGRVSEARDTFYSIARSRLRFLNENDMAKWQGDHGRPGIVTNASYIIGINTNTHFSVDEEVAPLVKNLLSSNKKTQDQILVEFADRIKVISIEKWITELDIVVNKDLFDRIQTYTGVDYTDITPYVVDHEIFEAWLTAKKGVGSTLSVDKKHLLARRRELLLAEQDGRAEKLFQYHMAINPISEKEYRYAWDKAKYRLGTL